MDETAKVIAKAIADAMQNVKKNRVLSSFSQLGQFDPDFISSDESLSIKWKRYKKNLKIFA